MSDGASPQAAAVPASADALPTPPDATKPEVQEVPIANGTINGDAVVSNGEEVAKEVAADDSMKRSFPPLSVVFTC